MKRMKAWKRYLSKDSNKPAVILPITGKILNYEDMPEGTIFYVGTLWKYKGNLVRISGRSCKEGCGGSMVFEDEKDNEFCRTCGPLEPKL
tara:strand:- start:74 stop:343 length:270 start_codon:yes stop_codon:yes gene_type:complete